MSDGPEESSRAADPTASFAEHVRTFHRSLPADEQVLLEEIFRLAALAETAAAAEVRGHQLTQVGPDIVTALITEIGFPALDAGSKDAAKLTIKLAPEYTRIRSKSGDAG